MISSSAAIYTIFYNTRRIPSRSLLLRRTYATSTDGIKDRKGAPIFILEKYALNINIVLMYIGIYVGIAYWNINNLPSVTINWWHRFSAGLMNNPRQNWIKQYSLWKMCRIAATATVPRNKKTFLINHLPRQISHTKTKSFVPSYAYLEKEFFGLFFFFIRSYLVILCIQSKEK